jgi:hypothetical protein
MHMVSFSIGSAPSDESCAQTGITANWVYLQQLECTVYRAALIARFGVPPEGARLAIKTHNHDFGSYAQVEIAFDRDNADSVGYFERIEEGLSTWLEANFTAPVDYDNRAQERVGSRRDAGDFITAALMTSQQLVNSGHATDREHDAVRHLSAAYPACAAEAASRLLAIAASRNVMPETMAALDRLQAAVDQMSDRRNDD